MTRCAWCARPLPFGYVPLETATGEPLFICRRCEQHIVASREALRRAAELETRR